MWAAAVAGTEASMISVGTPPDADGVPDLSYVERVCREIGGAVAAKGPSMPWCCAAPVPPGTTQRCAEILARSPAIASLFHVAFNPEFLREGSAIHDLRPPGLHGHSSDDLDRRARRFASCTRRSRRRYNVVPLAVARDGQVCGQYLHATRSASPNEVGEWPSIRRPMVARSWGSIAQDAKLNVSPV